MQTYTFKQYTQAFWQRLRPLQSDGRKPDGQQPPDLDELWRDFNQKMNKWLGGGANKTPAGQTPPSGSQGPAPWAWVPLLVGAFAVLWLASGTFMVQEGQQAVITRLGKLHSKAYPGLQWRWPYPIEQHETVNTSALRSIEIGTGSIIGISGLPDSSMLTQDENIVDVRFTVQYILKSAEAYLFNNKNDKEDSMVRAAAESAIREVVGRVGMDTVLNKDRESIQRDVMRSVQTQLDRYAAGVEVKNVNIQNVQPPEKVQAAFDDALKAGQDRDRLKNQGLAYAKKMIAEAKGEAARLTEESEGYKARILGKAKGDAQRFNQVVAEYQKAPQVTRDRMYLDAMQEVYAKTNKVLIDSRSGNNLINLPLDKMMQNQVLTDAAAQEQARSAAARATAPAAAAGAVPPANDARAREDGRSRSREVR